MQTTQINKEQVVELIESIWDSMLSIPISNADGDCVIRDAAGFMACVQISGAWNGMVLLAPTEGFARRAASIMLAVSEEELQVVDMLDAIAELCNMIGGGIKSLLPGPSHLSLPTVMQGARYAIRIPNTQVMCQMQFRCESEMLELRVFEGATSAR